MARHTEYVTVQGKTKYAQTGAPNQWGMYKITIYPDDASKTKIAELKQRGIRNRLEKDDDGYYMSFNRPASRDIRGEKVSFGPPKVTDRDGNPLTEYLGPGSDVTVDLEVYGFEHQGSKGIAARLTSIRVDNLIPYVRADADMSKANFNLNKVEPQPEALW